MKRIISAVLVLIIIVALLATSGVLVYNAVKSQTMEVKNPTITFEIENQGKVKVELYPEYAPNTVKNMIALAEGGYYTDKVVYGKDDIALYIGRNAEGETTNPKVNDIDKSVSAEDTEKNYEYEIDGEFADNNFKQNTLKYEKGALSMVRLDYTQQVQNLTEESNNSASSQFTIAMDNVKSLNGRYAVFGKVVEGMDIVENIYNLNVKADEVDEEGNVKEASIKQFETYPKILSATVEKYDVEYGLPEIHKAFDYVNYLTNQTQNRVNN